MATAKLQKEGELGAKDHAVTRYITVILSAVQSFGIAVGWRRPAISSSTQGPDHLMTMLTLTRQRLHHVAGRADHRARRGQRHVVLILLHRRGLPRGVVDLIDKAKTAPGRVDPDSHGRAGDLMIAVVALSSGGTQRTPHSGAVCEARSGAQGMGGHPRFTFARECRGVMPVILRLRSDVASDDWLRAESTGTLEI